MNQDKPELLILTLETYCAPRVKTFLEEKYDCTYINRPNKNYSIDDVDLILFTGGKDISSHLYNENSHPKTIVDYKRDLRESSVFDSYPKTIPRLGICRGAQLITALSGGKIVQDVNNHSMNHEMIVENNKRIRVTSTHHQMMYPFNIDETEYKIIGYADNLSTRYENDKFAVEISKPLNFVEPEIVYYNNTNSLAIQGHPEKYDATMAFKQYSYNLINKLINNEL